MKKRILCLCSIVVLTAVMLLSLVSCKKTDLLSGTAEFSSLGTRISDNDGALSFSGFFGDSPLESYSLALGELEYSGDIAYRSFIQDEGWQGWKTGSDVSGKEDKNILGIQIMLIGHVANYYDISYRVRYSSEWQEWVSNGTLAGETSTPIVGLEVRLSPKTDNIRDTAWTLTEYGDDDGRQSEFYTLKNNDTGTLIVIDGGWDANTSQVRSVINMLGGHVDYWFITHYDADHVSAFNNIYADPGDITIGTVYATPLDYDLYCTYAADRWWDTPEVYERFLNQTSGDERIVYLSRDDSFTIDGLDVYVYNAFDQIVVDTGNPDVANYGSLMFKITGVSDSFLVCGDVYGDVMGSILLNMYGSDMRANIVQPGHHGNHSMSADFYAVIEPSIMFFDGPKWLTEGEEYTAKDLIAWCEERGITYYEYSTAPNSIPFE